MAVEYFSRFFINQMELIYMKAECLMEYIRHIMEFFFYTKHLMTDQPLYLQHFSIFSKGWDQDGALKLVHSNFLYWL